MKIPRLSTRAWLVCWGLLLVGLLTQGGPSHAQTWSAWQSIEDGNQNLLLYRTMTFADSTTQSGYIIQYEITSQYSTAAVFNVTFLHDGGHADIWKWHLSPNTSCEGSLDAHQLESVSAVILQFHPSDPDPN